MTVHPPFPLPRRPGRKVSVGGISLGGDGPVVVQTMTKTDTRDPETTSQQVASLAAAGAEMIRVAVPDREAALALRSIREASPVPLVADIHFDYRLALLALDAGVDKLRINPGNIGSARGVREVVSAARSAGAAIRVGVNAGSLEPDIEDRLGRGPNALVESALRHCAILEDMGFESIVLSVKASSVADTVNANLALRDRTQWPLHLGVTEAGVTRTGTVKSATGIGLCLAMGVGDTIRVSLTADPLEEVRVAWDLLASWGIRSRGIEVISCPTCGRCQVDLVEIAREVSEALQDLKGSLVVAVMGCPVNGPGEAAAADLGVAMGTRGGVLFRDGEVLGRVAPDQVVARLSDLVRRELEQRRD